METADHMMSYREWCIWRDSLLRELDIDRQTRSTIADMLDRMRVENRQANEIRLEAMNEFRAQLTSQAGTFLTREVYDREHKAVGERVTRIENKQANFDGRMAVYSAVAAVVGAVIASSIGSVIYVIVQSR